MLFRKLTMDVRSYVQKCVDNEKDVNLQFAIKAKLSPVGLSTLLLLEIGDKQIRRALEQGFHSLLIHQYIGGARRRGLYHLYLIAYFWCTCASISICYFMKRNYIKNDGSCDRMCFEFKYFVK